MKRRPLLAAVAAALAWPRLARAAAHNAPVPSGTSALANPGIQLYTLRSLMAKDLEGTLAAVAEIGYREVEPHDWFGRTPAEFRAQLDRHGLRAPSGHVALDTFRRDAAAAFAAASTVGHQYAVVPWVALDRRGDADTWRRFADELNRLGEQARAAGLRLGYHNHDFEFAATGGGSLPFDLLLERTDRELVWFELDLYWITKGGQDPARYLRSGTGRYAMVHVKDMDATPARAMTDPGTGIVDFPTLLPLARAAGVRHWYVEHDNPRDPLATARAGFDYLSRLELR